MGRLGFNLVRQKDASKNVESGAVVPDQQQNERNENIEISELILAIDERNRTIKNYRMLLLTLTTVIICLCGYILLTQARVFHSTQEAVTTINKLQEYSNRMEALQGQYEVLNAVKLEQTKNCTLEESALLSEKEKLQREFDNEKSQRSKDNLEANEKYSILQESFETLQSEHETLAAHCLQKEGDLQTQVKKLQEERAELLGKVEANNRKIELRAQRQTPRTTTTTTPAPRSLGIFNTDQFKKINDLVKDIESGAALFDFKGFMKRTDDVFGIDHQK